MRIERVTPDNWQQMSENAHLICFGEKKPASWDKIDFALLGVNEDGVPLGYITCRENDENSLYWQFGGAFPGTRETVASFRYYREAFIYCMDRYKHINTYIKNTNQVMLKMAMKVGFLITGIRNFCGEVYVELSAVRA